MPAGPWSGAEVSDCTGTERPSAQLPAMIQGLIHQEAAPAIADQGGVIEGPRHPRPRRLPSVECTIAVLGSANNPKRGRHLSPDPGLRMQCDAETWRKRLVNHPLAPMYFENGAIGKTTRPPPPAHARIGQPARGSQNSPRPTGLNRQNRQ